LKDVGRGQQARHAHRDGWIRQGHPRGGSADAEFASAAAEGVRQWRFTQTRLDGVPVEVRMRVHVTFYTVQ
jgi:hypothetical protein